MAKRSTAWPCTLRARLPSCSCSRRHKTEGRLAPGAPTPYSVRSMREHIQALKAEADVPRLTDILDRIVAERAWHARFLNTLARLEYVGVRKMLKCRRSEQLDMEGLQHMVEEAAHAVRLKKAALGVAGTEIDVA